MPDSSTILLVDDEDAVQKLLAYPLERDGFRVLQARDGQEALERFEREHVDLVVLDVMLPKLDGLEVCKRLRASSAVPIIMLTARDDELDKVLGLELGADDYITKPFSIREFRSRVRAVLRRAAAPRHERSAEVIEVQFDLLLHALPKPNFMAQLKKIHLFLHFRHLCVAFKSRGPNFVNGVLQIELLLRVLVHCFECGLQQQPISL